jgi:glycolate oxidase
MLLKKEIYRALEDVVGAENISEDPAILDSYAWCGLYATAQKPITPEDEKKEELRYPFAKRAEAVLLPGNTAEVQTIVKHCNRYGTKFKAFSTGWIGGNVPATPGVILLDLRRMNHILEINEKNMYAVVEPYVISGQLHAELIKRGLVHNPLSAGAQTSALPMAALQGTGHLSQTTSNGERNVLAVEWVTPEGEIIRLGSLGSSSEWFCGDGPGPSLRGIIRGITTPKGGLGVYTKAATKVYHWPGPPSFEMEGLPPNYIPREIPPNLMIRYYSFPSYEKVDEAQSKIGENETVFAFMGFPISMVASNIATSNQEDVELLQKLRGMVQGPGFLVVVAGNSQREFEYKKRVLLKIIEETDGKSLEYLEDSKIGGSLLWRTLRPTADARTICRATGYFAAIFPGHSQFLPITMHTQQVMDWKSENLIPKGLVFDDGGCAFPWTEEHGSFAHAEAFFRFSGRPKSIKAVQQIIAKAWKLHLQEPVGVPFNAVGDQLHDLMGTSASNYHLWLRKIKKAFDPNGTSDSAGYITAKE